MGVPADSADCGIVEDIMHGEREILQVPYSKWCRGYENISTPCWSVGRLIEIYLIARGVDTSYFQVNRGENMIEYIIRLYKEKVKDMDFSKLEE